MTPPSSPSSSSSNSRRALLALLLLPASAGALEGSSGAAALSAPMETAGATARGAGMGGSLLAGEDDASLLLLNPGALGRLKRPQVSLHHNSWIADVSQETVLLGLPLGEKGGFGAMANYVNYGHFQGRDETGRLTHALGASDLGLGSGYGHAISSWLSAGVFLKTLQQTLADASYTTYSADFGFQAAPLPGLDAGFSFANLGTSVAGSERAMIWRAGAAWRLESPESWAVLLAANMAFQPKGEHRLHLGFEADLDSRLFLRAGYAVPLQDSELRGLRNFSCGAGFSLGALKLDYAFQPLGDLGLTQRVSVAYSFVEAPPRRQAVPVPTPAATPVPSATPSPVPALPPPPPKASPPRAEASPRPAPELVFHVSGADLEEARGLASRGLDRQALQAYSEALKKAPEDAVAWKEMGALYLKLGRKDFAKRCFEEAFRLNPREKQPLLAP